MLIHAATNATVTGGFPSQRGINTESVSVSLGHDGSCRSPKFPYSISVFAVTSEYSTDRIFCQIHSWWRHQMETISALLAICAGNSPVPGEFPAQRPVTRSFDVFFDLHPNKRLSKQWPGWWFETLPCLLWRHRNVLKIFITEITDCLLFGTFLLSI